MTSPNTERLIRQTLAEINSAIKSGSLDVRVLVNRLREQVILRIIEGERFSIGLTGDVEQMLDQILKDFSTRLQDQMTEDGRRVFVRGIKVVDAAVRSANLMVAMPYVSETILDELKAFRAELITGLTADIRKNIVTEIRLAAMGQKPVREVIQAIGKNLKSPSIFATTLSRSEVIYTTEISRIHTIAAFKRMQQAALTVKDMQKRWLHSHVGEPRLNHLAMDGTTIPVNDRFNLLGKDGRTYKILHPYDPLLPAGEVISCRCVLIPKIVRYEKAFPRAIPARVLVP